MLSSYDAYLFLASGVTIIMSLVAAFIFIVNFLAVRQERAQHKTSH
jgi:hypothetical protein